MKETELLQMALGLAAPWQVEDCDFDADERRLNIYLEFPKGSAFACPDCGRKCKAYDTEMKTWRHLNFFEHETYLHARTPRVDCPECGVKVVAAPWARPGSGFTLLFEAYVMVLAKEMPVNAIARLVDEHDTRLWRILHHYVEQARSEQDLASMTRLGIDETSRKRGHRYITVFVDLDAAKVVFATEGKDAETVREFAADLKEHGGKPEQLREVCCDMSKAFISGVGETLKEAKITFDKFHVMQLMNEALDQVRRQEQKERPELAKSRYAWLKNPANLKPSQKERLAPLLLPKLKLKTARAYRLKLTFQEFYRQSRKDAEAFLKKWHSWAIRSRLEPFVKAARTIKRHWAGVLRWFTSRITNGLLEGINSLIQAAKAKARGYRSTRNLITIVYLICGKLNFKLPT